MKKSYLSVLLCVALLLSSISVMSVMPVSASDAMNLLEGTATGSEAGLEFALEDNVFTFSATAAEQEVCIELENEVNLNDYPIWQIVLKTDMQWDIALYDQNNAKYMFAASDFCYSFGDGFLPWNPLPAGTYAASCDLTDAYTWLWGNLPANAAIKSITFIAKEAGTMTVTSCQLADGLANVDLNTHGDVSGEIVEESYNLLDNPYTNWSAEDQSDILVTKGDNGAMILGNTNGMWPAASYTFETPYVVSENAALDLDFSVAKGCKTTIYVFFGPSTPENFGEGAYLWIYDPADIMSPELSGGTYKGTVFLKDIIRKSIANLDAVDRCYDENGNFVITGLRIFAISDTPTEQAVTFNRFQLQDYAALQPPTKPTKPTLYAGPDLLAGEKAIGNGMYDYDPDEGLTIVGNTVECETSITYDVGYADLAENPYLELSVEAQVDFDICLWDKNTEAWIVLAAEYFPEFQEQNPACTPYEIAAGTYSDVCLDIGAFYRYVYGEMPADAELTSVHIYTKAPGKVKVTKMRLMTENAPSQVPIGDVTGDGEVNLADASRLFYAVNGLLELSETELSNADVTGDGEINLGDATMLFYIVNGLA